jgi:hypothetical protein
MTAEFESEYNELVSQIMNLPTAVQAVKLLPTAKAALLLNCSVSTLEKRRQSHKPPPPAPNYAGGVKGKEVKYLASTLIEFIQGQEISQPSPYVQVAALPLAKNAATARRSGLAAAGGRSHLMKYGSDLSQDDAAAASPFFVNQDGLLLAHCWESPSMTLDLFLDDSSDVKWLQWQDALAAVWLDESRRLAWLREADVVAPDLRKRVEADRHAALSRI